MFKFNPFTGKFDIVSDLSGFVPYTGATADLDLGADYVLKTTAVEMNNTGAFSFFSDLGITPLFTLSGNGSVGILQLSNGTDVVNLDFSGLTDTRAITIPNASGTLALTSDIPSITGLATKALDNLASVAINTSLISDADSTDDLGSTSNQWANVYTDRLVSTISDLIIENDLSDGDITFKVNDGGVDTTVMTIDGATSCVGIGDTTPDAQLDVQSGAATTIGLITQGAASQSADLQQWQKSDNTVLARITSAGHIAYNSLGFGPDANAGIDSQTYMYTAANYTRGLSSTLSCRVAQNNFHGPTGLVATVDMQQASGSYQCATGLSFSVINVLRGTATAYRMDGVSGFIRNASNTSATSYAHAINGEVDQTGSATSGEIAGINVSFAMSAGGMNHGYSLHLQPVAVSGGTLSTYYGINIGAPSITGSGAITNAYGLYINSIAGAVTNNYAIITNAGHVVFNEGGDSATDFRVESDTYDALFIDASENSIDIMHHASGKVGFFAVTPVTQQTELTDELTTITFTAPGTPDYIIADLVSSGDGATFGFSTKDEGNTVLSVIANLQARVNELETKLTAYGLLIDAD